MNNIDRFPPINDESLDEIDERIENEELLGEAKVDTED